MKTATVTELKRELKTYPPGELMELCLKLAKFKKENKELLTYLLFEASNEHSFIESVKVEIDEQFDQINTKSYFYIKKSVRKILRNVKKYIRYSKQKQTEVELLLYFCKKLKTMTPPVDRSRILKNLYLRQLEILKKAIGKLHEDLQYDYEREMEEVGSSK